MQFGDTRLKLSREIPLEDVCGGIFDGFYCCSLRPEVVSYVISGMADQDVGMGVCANIGDSRLKPSIGGVIFGPSSNVDNFRPEVYSDVISSVIVDLRGVRIHVKFGNSRYNQSRDIYDCLTLL